MRRVRVSRVGGNRALDRCPSRRQSAILGQRHGMIGQEPEVVAVVRRQAVHQFGNLVLLANASGAAEQAVGVCGGRDNQRIARPRRQVRVQGGDRIVGPAGKSEIEERDVTGFSLRQARNEALGCRQRRTRGRDIAFSRQHLRLAGMGHGKTGVGGNGLVVCLSRAGVKGQREIGRLDVGVPCRSRPRGQGQPVAIRQHHNPHLFRRQIYRMDIPTCGRKMREHDLRGRCRVSREIIGRWAHCRLRSDQDQGHA